MTTQYFIVKDTIENAYMHDTETEKILDKLPDQCRSDSIQPTCPIIRVQLLTPTAKMPVHLHPSGSGVGLIADIRIPFRLMPHSIGELPTGLAVGIPVGYEGLIWPRFELTSCGIIVCSGVRTINSCYHGELMVLLINLSGRTYVIDPGDSIAQLVIVPVVHALFCHVDRLAEDGEIEIMPRFGTTIETTEHSISRKGRNKEIVHE